MQLLGTTLMLLLILYVQLGFITTTARPHFFSDCFLFTTSLSVQFFMASSSSFSSSSGHWLYDVFPSFSGEDVRKTFLSHFLKELDRKLIISFIDNKIQRSRSLDPELKNAIRSSRIAVVVFSKNYASSSWCLNELLEIVRCKKECGQMVIPIFYRLDPSDVRKQTGDFGKIFEKTCQNKAEDEKIRWQGALTGVANIVGYHIVTWANEASMVEEIASDILDKLNLSPSNDFEDFVGIEDHITEMCSFLHMESDEVRMVGIWGSSGIGKTTIARALFSRLSCQFQSSVFIDRVFISKSMEVYGRADRVDYNMKLHLQRTFLAEILDKKDIKIDYIGATEKMLKHRKALIFIDDLDDQDVLDALAGQTQWFGSGSRIIVVTQNKHFLRAHGIEHIYEVCLPSKDLALEMFCRFAFRKKSPPDGFMELASEVVFRAGKLPLGLDVLGSYLRGRDKEDWIDMLPRLRNGLDGKIEKTLRVSYDGLNNKKDEAIFRHIACLFNGEKVNDIKVLLADSNLDVNIGIKNLLDRSLIHERYNTVEMHSLLQEMGKEIVRTQSNKPGEQEFLFDSKDVCAVLKDNTGTKEVLGISLDTDETDELHIHESAFIGMDNLLFLKLYSKKWDWKKEVRWHLPERLDYLPPKLRLLWFDSFPMRFLPSNFCPKNLVKLQMQWSKLEKLWEGVHPLTGLKNMDLSGSENLKEIPDLSMATNLETLNLSCCSSLVELPLSIQYLDKLNELDLSLCDNLETLPTGINLKSLYTLNLNGCFRLKSFPEISTNISELNVGQTSIEEFPSNLHFENLSSLALSRMESPKLWKSVQPLTPLTAMLSPSLTTLFLSNIPSLVELPSSIQNFHKLTDLGIRGCKNLESLPTDINLKSLDRLFLSGCSRLRTFPDISRNISELYLNNTAVEEVPWWIENFSDLHWLHMDECNNLRRVSLNILKLKHLQTADFSDCMALTEASWNDSTNEVAIATASIHSELPLSDEASSSLRDDYFSMVELNFINCFNFDPKALIQQQTVYMELILSGEEVPSYFTHRTTGTSLTNIPLPHTSPSQPFFSFRGCAVVNVGSISTFRLSFKIQVCCRFIDRLGSHFDSAYSPQDVSTMKLGGHLVIFDCCFPLIEDITSLADQVHYDHVDIQFRLIEEDAQSQLKLKGCGIQLPENSRSPGNRLCKPYIILAHNCGGNTSNNANLGGHGTEQTQECGDSPVEIKSSMTKLVVMKMGTLLKKLLTCYAANQQDT